jgi:hypothetical protein
MMDKHTDTAVYLNAHGIIPFMHDAMDPNNNLADVLMDCNTCPAYLLKDRIIWLGPGPKSKCMIRLDFVSAFV